MNPVSRYATYLAPNSITAFALSLRIVLAGTLLALVGCAGGPPTPDWQADAHGAVQRATRADLQGLDRLAQMEWSQAEAAVSSTARPDLLARLALTRCAIGQARLQAVTCDGYERLAGDATPQDRAYRAYLNATASMNDVAALPEAHRAVARLLTVVPGTDPVASAKLLAAIPDPVSRLVAGSVLWRADRLDADGLQVLVDTASAQGWRGALMAWLVAQRAAALNAGQTVLADAVERRIGLLSASATARPAPKAD